MILSSCASNILHFANRCQSTVATCNFAEETC